ncbi:hypothetical protein [uncultured Pontibacter sp.]|uniref:hypothetical protein n=1 Tax=uncultured Pontibacter sp. TaxID=453356 RepID=UPI00261DEAC5|nr:hypothetical protein [uncultured Pontibacter sp.]
MSYFIESTYYTCKYSASLSLLETVWHGAIPSSEIQAAFKEIAAILNDKAIDYLLVDSRLSNAFKITDEQWVRTFVMPLLASTGIKRLARLACPTVIQQHIVTGIISAIDYEQQYGFRMRTFREKEEAMDWLFIPEAIKEQMPYRGDYRAFSLI